MQVRNGTLPDPVGGESDDPEREAIRKLMDPAALEARLAVARARRAEVMAAKGKGSRDADRAPLPKGPVAPIPSEDVRADKEVPSNPPMTFPLAARTRMSAQAKERPNQFAESAPPASYNAVAVIHDTDRQPAKRLEAVSDEDGHAVVPHVAVPRKRQSPVLIAAILLSGAAIGAVSTLMLQFKGWQIAIVPPAVESGLEPRDGAEPAPAPSEAAGSETVAPVTVTAGAPAPAAGGSPADAVPAAVSERPEFPDTASGQEVAAIDWPSTGEPIRRSPLPDLSSAEPVGTSVPQIASLPWPAPEPPVTNALQASSFDIGIPVFPDLPAGRGPDPLDLRLSMADTPSLPPVPREDALPSPSPPAESPLAAESPEAEPAITPRTSRVALHFPAVSPAEADQVSAELTKAGFADVAAYPASIQISSTQVRYYHESDRAAAEEVAASTSTAFDGAAVAVRSFTNSQSRPPEGFLEVWLQGDAPTAPPRAQARASGASGRAQDPVDRATAAARRVTQQERERQRLAGAVQELLRDQLD